MNNVTRVELYDLNTDTELAVDVRWQACPAEPDVGIMRRYAEISCVSVDLFPFGEVIFYPTNEHNDKIDEEIGEQMSESIWDERP